MADEFTPEEIEILSKYVTNPTGNTFCVNIPGLAGPIYARYSRAVTGLRRTLLKEFLKDGVLNVSRTQELIERILNEYGDDSVGELEGAHLAFEQISNLATKVVEDCRIGGSPIEQSTRYVYYYQKNTQGEYRYYRGPEIMNSSLAADYTETLDFIFDTYASAVEPLTILLKKLKPLEEVEYEIRGPGVKEKYDEMDSEQLQKQFRVTYNIDLKTKACDILRCLLPAATLTNVGLFGNGRFYQGLLTRLYSHPLLECNRLAVDAHEELNKIIPKFVKRAKRDEYAINTEETMQQLTSRLLAGVAPDRGMELTLLPMVSGPEDHYNLTVAACLYRFSQHPIEQLIRFVRQISPQHKQEIIEAYSGERKNRRNRPGRAFEHGYPLTFEVQADFGAYRDLQRHRMLTQERQLLNPDLGYISPPELEEIGFADRVNLCFDRSAELYRKIREALSPEIAQYAVLFGYRIRWVMGMNFREAMHMIELRTAPQGHESYRTVCKQMMDAIRSRHPEIAETFRFVDYNQYYWSRAESEARQRQKERFIDSKYKSD